MGEGIPAVEFAPAQGARIAYQVFGRDRGDAPAIVAVPPTAQNIEASWERRELRAMFDRFASFSSYLHFDKRGTGSSDRRSVMPGLDERVDDLRAVMDHADIEHAYLYAASEGGPMAILFAATYPHRVDGLILHGAWARFPQAAMTDATRDELRHGVDTFAERWGTPTSPMVDGFAPSLADDDEFRQWHQRYERKAATADAIRDLMHLMIDFDVREVLPTLDVPTLVLHRRGDRIVPLPLGEELAEGIPGARLVVQDGPDHFSYVGEIDPWLDEVERFVTGDVQSRPSASRDPQVRITTMGRFAVEVDGCEIAASDWGSRRARTLCKRLAVARGWPVTRDELIELLWPDDPEVHRLGARLSVQLSTVRRVLQGGVVADRDTVRLDAVEVETDLDAFWSAETDEEVVECYGGELLPEDRYDDWTASHRDQVRERFVGAARRRAAVLIEADPVAGAVLARRVVDADRFDIEAHRVLIVALERSGETGAAQRAREALASVADELDIDLDASAVDRKVL